MPKSAKTSSAEKKTPSRKKKRVVAAHRKKNNLSSKRQKSKLSKIALTLSDKFMSPIRKLSDLRSRRTHKTFKRSQRRDYVRVLTLPGYVRFTGQVFAMLHNNKRLFVGLSVIATVLALVLSGLTSHQLYLTISDSVTAGNDEVPLALQVGTLVMATAGLLTTGGSEAQQVYIGIIALMTWLTTVWLLRELMTGQRPRLRDGLYSSGSPIIATAIVALLLLLQMIPVGLLAIVYTALSSTGLINEGLGALLFFGVAALIITLTLYWVTSTLFAMVIVTLPGMYPWRAMKAASDIIVGRRLRILYRVIWMILVVVILWVIVIAPIVMLNTWLVENIEWFNIVPLVPVVSIWLTMILTVWVATYVYLLYRKVVTSDAESSS